MNATPPSLTSTPSWPQPTVSPARHPSFIRSPPPLPDLTLFSPCVRPPVVGCHSLRAINSWYRVHADDSRLVAKLVTKRDRRPYLLPRLPVESVAETEEAVSLDAYLSELLTLQSKHPTTSFSSLDDTEPLPPPLPTPHTAPSPRLSDGWRQLSRQDSRVSNRSDGDANAATSRPFQPPSPSAGAATLTVPDHSPALSASSVSSASSTPVPTAAAPASVAAVPFAPIALPPSQHAAALASQQPSFATNGAEEELSGDAAAVSAHEVERIEGDDATRTFLASFLDTLYTVRQRRASSIIIPDGATSLSSLLSSHPQNSSSSLSRRHLRSIHPNLPAIDEVMETESAYVVLMRHFPRTLAAFLRTGSMRSESDESKLFLLYQCLHCLSFLHERAIVHGDLKTRNVMVTGNSWVYLTGLQCPAVPRPVEAYRREDSALMRWSAQRTRTANGRRLPQAAPRADDSLRMCGAAGYAETSATTTTS